MDLDATFICAEPEGCWIEDLIFQVLKEFPVELFGGTNPFDSVLTLAPFIKQFNVVDGKHTTTKVRKRIVVSKDIIFPKDQRDSQKSFEEYIYRKPLFIMITGDLKPSFFEIGIEMCKQFGTHNITPVQLIKQQIMRRTQIGKWLHRNLKEKRGIPIWIVMKLLEAELESSVYLHKGYILTGFPIIPELNPTPDSFEILIDYRDFEEQYSNVPSMENLSDQEIEYNQEEADSIQSVGSSPSIDLDSQSQEDISKTLRNTKFLELDIGENSVLTNCIQKQLDIIYHLNHRPDYLVYLDTYYYTQKYAIIIDILQEFCLAYYRENVVRIDFRIGMDTVCDCIRNRFKYKNYKINYECVKVNTFGRSDMSLEELCDMEKVLPNRKWWISKFGKMCPVELQKGRRRYCDSKYPVRYLRYIFLFYSSKERNTFVSNPQKYIHAKPACRIAVIGPHRTGKSTLSQFIAQYFKADIYQNHIGQTEYNINDYMINDVEKELAYLEKLAGHSKLRSKKVTEWTECVLTELNNILNKAFKMTDIFENKLAEKYFETKFRYSDDDEELKSLILENVNFNKSIQNISSNAFLDWVSTHSISERNRQYVLDSAPLNIKFWQDLLFNDELPDCIFFLNPSSLEKVFDLYSFVHSENCINDELIYENMCTLFEEWKEQFGERVTRKPFQGTPMNDFTLHYHKHLVTKRYKEAVDFVNQYTKLQSFLLKHDVVCINIDISKQSWTQSILMGLVTYMSKFQSEAYALYEPSLENRMKLDFGEISNKKQSWSTLSNNNSSVDEQRESKLSSTDFFDFGDCLDWCPVKLKENNVLLKGDVQYCASYRNKIYVMHSKNALTEFLARPILYLLNEPIVPPARVFCLGLTHGTKVRFAHNLASYLNVECITYAKKHMKAIPTSRVWTEGFSIDIMKGDWHKLNKNIMQELKREYKRGALILGFPLLLEQFNDAIASNIYPESVLIFDEDQDVLDEIIRLFTRHMTIQSSKDEIENKSKHIQQLFRSEIVKIENACHKFQIPVIKVTKHFNRPEVVRYYANQINRGRSRRSLFENIEGISLKESGVLLRSGCYRYSRFKYSCPVDVTRMISLNQYEGQQKYGNIFPCVYRDFIYFLNGRSNLKAFRRNALEFINTCNPPQMNDPLRIAVYGPPKSGTSTICRMISNELGLKVFSKDDILERPITNAAIIDLLKRNNSIAPNGIVLDNLPLNPKLLFETAKKTLDISAVFIIIPTFKKVVENFCLRYKKLKHCPSLQLNELYQKYRESMKEIIKIPKSTETSMFNIHYLDGNQNSWTLWESIKYEIIKTSRCISGYRIKLKRDRCATLGHLNLFYDNILFKRKIHQFYCPVCLAMDKLTAFKYFYINVGPEFYSTECQKLLNLPYGYLNEDMYTEFKFDQPFEINELVEPFATQKKYFICTSLFQYRERFFWTCNDHTIDLMTNIHKFYNLNKMPMYVPFLVLGYIKEFVTCNGLCPVEYERGNFVKGNMNLSVYYRSKVYLLSCKENVHEFLSYPEKYFKPQMTGCLGVHEAGTRNLRILCEDAITANLFELTNARPKHFGLDCTQSALTYLALRLKIQNCQPRNSEHWNTAFYNYVKDCRYLSKKLKQLKEQINPFIDF